jgi:hypothetical protein
MKHFMIASVKLLNIKVKHRIGNRIAIIIENNNPFKSMCASINILLTIIIYKKSCI